MAEQLRIPYERFRPLWSKRRHARDVGELTCEGSIRVVCGEVGIVPEEDGLRLASEVRVAFFERTLVPREGAVETLRALGSRGLRIGLLSDASAEIPSLWDASTMAPFVQTAVFSCTERTVKPDPRLYAAIAQRLGVGPNDCLYVANGERDELAGAVAAGMRAVLFTAPGDLPGPEAATWEGPRIPVLADVLGMV